MCHLLVLIAVFFFESIDAGLNSIYFIYCPFLRSISLMSALNNSLVSLSIKDLLFLSLYHIGHKKTAGYNKIYPSFFVLNLLHYKKCQCVLKNDRY